jgi:UPF0755 protein
MNDILPPKRPLGQQGVNQPKPMGPNQQIRRGVVHPMSMDVKRPLNPTARPPQAPPSEEKLIEAPEQPPLLENKPKRSLKKMILWGIATLVALLVVAAVAAFVWYQNALTPLSSSTDKTRITVESGSTYDQIGGELQDKGIIRSKLAFTIYTRITGTHGSLQAGTYSLSPSESVPQIVNHLTSGKVDQFSITFLPGATLAENRKGLIDAGFSETEVDAALKKTYQSPLFEGKPSSSDLEGYIYGETYTFSSDTSVETVLQTTFDEFYSKLTKAGVLDGFKKQGLSLYQAITLASIIQREVPTSSDQKQVAQVFFKRLQENMPLGSDVTYQYAAKKLGVAPTPDLDSPYNTRKYPGLPPGPIATPGLSALEAVANPASGDYLYFLSGDDDVTYFARTSDEHEKNIKEHCQIKCSVF